MFFVCSSSGYLTKPILASFVNTFDNYSVSAMPMIDSERDVVVIRMVYDGPPYAGKTANLYALQNVLKTRGQVYTPLPNDNSSSTKYFEWLDYVGGIFNGRPIACQIIATPGDPKLESRRHYLLTTADVVVFVLDSRVTEVAVGLEYFRTLEHILRKSDPPVRVIIQANKQDAPNSLPEERLHLFFSPQVRIMEAAVILNKGVRDTFVYAVNLGIERLRDIMHQGKLIMDIPKVRDGESLYQHLEAQSLEPKGDQLLASLLSDE